MTSGKVFIGVDLGAGSGRVIAALGLPRKIFGEVVAPGTVLGPIREEGAAFIGRAGFDPEFVRVPDFCAG